MTGLPVPCGRVARRGESHRHRIADEVEVVLVPKILRRSMRPRPPMACPELDGAGRPGVGRFAAGWRIAAVPRRPCGRAGGVRVARALGSARWPRVFGACGTLGRRRAGSAWPVASPVLVLHRGGGRRADSGVVWWLLFSVPIGGWTR